MRLLLKDHKYARAIRAMNMNHGRDFDCMTVDCPVCSPYREEERKKWESMTDKEKQNTHWGRIG